MPGIENGETFFSIDISTTSNAWKTQEYLIPIKELWFEGTSYADGSTSITNAAAPDGIITDFQLGTGNNTGLTNLFPSAQSFNPDASGAAEYFVDVRVNGTSVSGYTYDTATTTISFTTAPADGSVLEAIYYVRSDAPAWDSGKRYGIGAVVSYDNAYFINDTPDTGTTPNSGTPASPWPAYTGFGYDNLAAAVGSPIVPFSASGNYFMLNSWDRLLSQ